MTPADLPVFWLSWWDDPDGKKGKYLTKEQQARFEVWVSGYRMSGEESLCARVEAPTEKAAWHLVDRMYPGASKGDVRFAERCEPGWWPPSDRFPPMKRGAR